MIPRSAVGPTADFSTGPGDQYICYSFIEKDKLDTCKLSVIWIVSVAEEAGLSLTWSETPKTGFLIC